MLTMSGEERGGEMGHTPGPWKVYNGSLVGHSDRIVIKNEDSFDWVCSMQCSNIPEYNDNARLIAAAPELLEALKGIIEIGKRDTTNPKYDGYFAEAKRAIAKAEGKA